MRFPELGVAGADRRQHRRGRHRHRGAARDRRRRQRRRAAEQAATPGEVLIGEATLELVRDAVESEPVEPLELKGKAEPVPAYRLVSAAEAPERSHESRFVGREREARSDRRGLAAGAARSSAASSSRSSATPGVGKSRLVAEALASDRRARRRGRCLPYGEGITYWPVVEVLKQLDALPSDPAAAAAIRSLLGETDAERSAEEIAWAFRKLLEEQAPLVVVFDDIQWGEETFLDLVEGVALLSSGAPILLVCMARPELLEQRGEWPVVAAARAARRADGRRADRRSARRAAGADRSRGRRQPALPHRDARHGRGRRADVDGPAHAPSAARRSPRPARPGRASACSSAARSRARSSTAAPSRRSLPRTAGHAAAAALVRSELIRPDRAQLPGEDGFRFRHLLIRDAAYDALPKATRAELHERFADWLEERGAELVELDEILGYHLEQAARYRHELGHRPGARRARRRALAAAGRRALWRGDERRRCPLLERALDLTRPSARRPPRARSRRGALQCGRRDEPPRSPRPPPSGLAQPATSRRGARPRRRRATTARPSRPTRSTSSSARARGAAAARGGRGPRRARARLGGAR